MSTATEARSQRKNNTLRTAPDGRPLASYVELAEESERERQRAERLAAQLPALGIEPER